jgi:hypothetical protein
MTRKNAVERIMKVLGLTSYSFYEAKTEQGMAVKMDGDLEVGKAIYVATEEGMIPAPPGIHIMDDGAEIEVAEDGTVSKIKMGKEKIPMEEETEVEGMEKKAEKMSDVELQFGDIKLKNGDVLRVEGDEPAVGLRLLKVGYDGSLSPIVDGKYETSDGKVISVDGGSIKGVQTVAEDTQRGTGTDAEKMDPLADIGKSDAMVFTEAKTVDGNIKLDSPTFDVGETIDVIKEDGTKEKAPDGEHEIILKDSEGNDVKIRVEVKDGKITERENVEEEMQDLTYTEEIAKVFSAAIKKLENKIDIMAAKQSELDKKFAKFSKEPAGSKVFTQKTINDEPVNPLMTKYEGFRKLRESLVKN